MAGKRQKPYDQLQNKRGNRRRPPIVLYQPIYADEDTRTPRERAIDVAISSIERQFGRGRLPKAAPEPSAMPRERAKRKYRPKAEQTPTPGKAAIAAARPRDAKGHFLPAPAGRQADTDYVHQLIIVRRLLEERRQLFFGEASDSCFEFLNAHANRLREESERGNPLFRDTRANT